MRRSASRDVAGDRGVERGKQDGAECTRASVIDGSAEDGAQEQRLEPARDGLGERLAVPDEQRGECGGDDVRAQHGGVGRGHRCDGPEQREIEVVRMARRVSDGGSRGRTQHLEDEVEGRLREEDGSGDTRARRPHAHEQRAERCEQRGDREDEQRMRCGSAAEGVRHGGE